MTTPNKEKQLKKHKIWATGLFLLMTVIFISCSISQKYYTEPWIGYVRAFSEAAMVGALADWFAVTALFHHPLGLKIPHTNLIQNKKEQIGNNLGNFIVENFLSPTSIRPYILQLKIAEKSSIWLSKEDNQNMIFSGLSQFIQEILHKIDDTAIELWIQSQISNLVSELKFNEIAGNSLSFAIEKNYHQELISNLTKQIIAYISQNKKMVREKVAKESFALIPKFIDDAIADKITEGIIVYFQEVNKDEKHGIREEISQKLRDFSENLKENPHWEKELTFLKEKLIQGKSIQEYTQNVWLSVKTSLINELNNKESVLKKYFHQNILQWSQKLLNDQTLQNNIDRKLRITVYKYVLKNAHKLGELISTTIERWEGKALSDKLELEVGKDLQFIRINGTLVGGLVGLLIHTIVQML